MGASDTHENNTIDEAIEVVVSKCCSDQQVLNMSNPGKPNCASELIQKSPFMRIEAIGSDQNLTKAPIHLIQDLKTLFKMPPCYFDYEVNPFDNYGIK